MAAFACACLTFAFQAAADESAPLVSSFTEVGWKGESKPMPFGKAVVISDGTKPRYVFLYEKKGSGFERDLLIDPNVDKKRSVKESAFSAGSLLRDIKEFAAFAGSVGMGSEAEAVKPITLVHPTKARKLTADESKAVVDAIRAQGALEKTFFDTKGGTAEGLPSGTVATEGWGFGDFYILKLKHARFASVSEEPILVRTRGNALSVIYAASEDGVFLPLRSGFDSIKALCTASKVGAIWNKVESDAGQAGTWLRQRLATAPAAEVWWPTQVEEILGKLDATAPHTGGLVYAKSGATAVAFFYTEEGEPQVVEFDDGEVRATLDLEDAATRAETTTEKELWQCYEGISRQFAHPAIVLAIYRNEAMRAG